MNNHQQIDVVIIGAGLTGLTTAYWLTKSGKQIRIVESQSRVGGQIRTFRENGFIYESGPNTGVVSYPEVAELFQALSPVCRIDEAREDAKRRLIWKGNCFHALPSGLFSAITTPLFTLYDKIRILGEPFRAKGTDPDESVGHLTERRLGRSFLQYAVDPFLSGVYAGDPMKLITRYALPKLYRLEEEYGSFIKGTIAKAKQPKSNRDRLATKRVFSAIGGLDHLTDAMAKAIGSDKILLSASDVRIQPHDEGERWAVTFLKEGQQQTIYSNHVVTTVGAYALPKLLPFIEKQEMDTISSLRYAPIVQVSVGYYNTEGITQNAFGGLVPTCERKKVLGILFPSCCFSGRAPEKGMLFSFFIAGVKHQEMIEWEDAAIEKLVRQELHTMFKFPEGKEPDMIHIFRHPKAIPQYEKSSGKRFETIDRIEQRYPGLILAGNIKGGIGMADRIRQATTIANSL